MCDGICKAHFDFDITGSWTTRPEPQPVFFKSDTTKIRSKRVGGNSKVKKVLKQLGYKSMKSLLTAFYPKSTGSRDTAEKINKKLKGLTITPSFICYYLAREGIPTRRPGGWQGGTK